MAAGLGQASSAGSSNSRSLDRGGGSCAGGVGERWDFTVLRGTPYCFKFSGNFCLPQLYRPLEQTEMERPCLVEARAVRGEAID